MQAYTLKTSAPQSSETPSSLFYLGLYHGGNGCDFLVSMCSLFEHTSGFPTFQDLTIWIIGAKQSSYTRV